MDVATVPMITVLKELITLFSALVGALRTLAGAVGLLSPHGDPLP
jgi:hypothetical protein